ncbi:MAG: hypothetical protein CL868_20035 [Cytophagaceae bacterium]|nr:hypothetical protein [Cytophagaceae bacterium]|tara:strand:+ start:1107 stop:1415 length:309 start_codon:yes stop_codon:yes gene_type:complete
MKTLITVISIVFFTFATPIDNDIKNNTLDTVEETLTFDGYEGEYFFFTDKDLNAVVLESQDETAAINDLRDNDEVGEEFNVTYSIAAQKEHPSSKGVIKEIK